MEIQPELIEIWQELKNGSGDNIIILQVSDIYVTEYASPHKSTQTRFWSKISEAREHAKFLATQWNQLWITQTGIQLKRPNQEKSLNVHNKINDKYI